ncbi:reverse transcriptase domain, reverse transcriptase zinc-binding domain protein [Tanacetum coccineum]
MSPGKSSEYFDQIFYENWCHVGSILSFSAYSPATYVAGEKSVTCSPISCSGRLLLDRLPTRHNLDARGIDMHSTRCAICDEGIEATHHLFIDCMLASRIWSSVATWWGLTDLPTSVDSLIKWGDTVNLNNSTKSCFNVVVQTTAWVIWRYRNRVCFDLKPPRKDTLLDDIKHRQYLSVDGENVGWEVVVFCNKDAIIQRFGSIFEDLMPALKNVKYEKNAREYQDLFDTLLCRVTISQEHAIKAILDAVKKKNKPSCPPNGNRFSNGAYYGNASKPAILPKPNTPTIIPKRILRKESTLTLFL